MTHKYTLLSIFTLIIALPSHAYAYLDPATGSLIIQALIGGLVTGLYFLKLYWRRIVGFFKKSDENDDLSADIELDKNDK